MWLNSDFHLTYHQSFNGTFLTLGCPILIEFSAFLINNTLRNYTVVDPLTILIYITNLIEYNKLLHERVIATGDISYESTNRPF
jgi:hypothetical protein